MLPLSQEVIQWHKKSIGLEGVKVPDKPLTLLGDFVQVTSHLWASGSSSAKPKGLLDRSCRT